MRIESGADNTPISVPGLLSKAVEEYGDVTALNYKLENKWVKVTYKYDILWIIILLKILFIVFVFIYREYEHNVRTVAKAFIKLGLERYHGVCIIGFNSPEWFYSDLGAIYAG